MNIINQNLDETQRVLRLAKWAAEEFPEMPQSISFLETWDKPLSRKNLHYDGESLSYHDQYLSFKIDQKGIQIGASFQKKKNSSKLSRFSSIFSLSILGALALPTLGYVFEKSLQAEEKRLHQEDCTILMQRKTDLDNNYYRDSEISSQEYKKEMETLNKAVTKHIQIWSDYCSLVKENVK